MAEGGAGGLDPRVVLAAERTLLAWVRTGLAMMGFGFVVARLGIFMRELAAVRHVLPDQHARISLWIGMALVVGGVAANVLAVVEHRITMRQLERGGHIRSSAVSPAPVMAVSVAVIGLLVALYLVFATAH
jgi:putative membrane protein